MIRSLIKMLLNNENIEKLLDMDNKTGVEQRIQNSLQLLSVMNLTIEDSTLPVEIKTSLLSLLNWIEDIYESMKNAKEEEIRDKVKELGKPINNIKEAFENIPKN